MRELPGEFRRDVDVLKFTVTRKKNEETIVQVRLPVTPHQWLCAFAFRFFRSRLMHCISSLQKVECLLEEESLPPAYRQDVADLIKYGKRPVPSRQL